MAAAAALGQRALFLQHLEVLSVAGMLVAGHTCHGARRGNVRDGGGCKPNDACDDVAPFELVSFFAAPGNNVIESAM